LSNYLKKRKKEIDLSRQDGACEGYLASFGENPVLISYRGGVGVS